MNAHKFRRARRASFQFIFPHGGQVILSRVYEKDIILSKNSIQALGLQRWCASSKTSRTRGMNDFGRPDDNGLNFYGHFWGGTIFCCGQWRGIGSLPPHGKTSPASERPVRARFKTSR